MQWLGSPKAHFHRLKRAPSTWGNFRICRNIHFQLPIRLVHILCCNIQKGNIEFALIVNLLGSIKAHFLRLLQLYNMEQIWNMKKTVIFKYHTNTHSVLKGKYRMYHDCEPPPLIHL